MIASIPAKGRPIIIEQRVPDHLLESMKTFRIEAAHHFGNVLPDRFSVLARAVLNRGPLTCLSCGAKTNGAGELPCGH
ncbi:hypothetical protein [Herbaspirillum robiniae]|uniref:hypothetical protein n=1 Tax=Herbaspirillum robiniae TaxID=2014887 RepID=UPI0011E4CFC5|nr:hypothetical protein [Herbaspirillum robiniae]